MIVFILVMLKFLYLIFLRLVTYEKGNGMGTVWW